MVKKQIVKKVSEIAELSEDEAYRAYDAILQVISEELVQGNKVTISGFGAFRVIQMPIREKHNPQNLEKVIVKEHKIVKFKCGKSLKDLVNGW